MSLTSLKNFLDIRLFWVVLACGYAWIFWPGWMSPDSWAIYKAALSHTYGDHHPPLMGYVWRYLIMIYDGPGLMLAVNMALLWGGVGVLAFRVFQGPLRWICLLLPFTPHVVVEAGWIWKDMIFTFGFGLLAAVLSAYSMHQKRLSMLGLTGVVGLLFYATSVKYQAQFVAPLMVLWLCRVQWPSDARLRSLIKAVLASVVLIVSIHQVNHALVTHHGKGSSHSWQYVKIYDLAGMSVRLDHNIVPSFLWRGAQVTPQELAKAYDLLWEPLIAYEDSPLRATQNASEREALLSVWRTSVMRYPWAYVQHRLFVWSSPLLTEVVGYHWFMNRFGHHIWAKHYIAPLFVCLYGVFFLLPSALLALFCLVYTRGRADLRPYRQSLTFMLSMACVLTGSLFVFSLAGVLRYHYFSLYVMTLTVPFTLRCLLPRLWVGEGADKPRHEERLADSLQNFPPQDVILQDRGTHTTSAL